MDPDRCLSSIREDLQLFRDKKERGEGWESTANLAETIIDQFQDLDDWISREGFLPEAWNHYKRIVRNRLIERMRMFMTDEQIVIALNYAEGL